MGLSDSELVALTEADDPGLAAKARTILLTDWPQAEQIGECCQASPEDACAFCDGEDGPVLGHTAEPQPVPAWLGKVLRDRAAVRSALISFCAGQEMLEMRLEPPRVRWRLRCFGLRHDYSVILAG